MDTSTRNLLIGSVLLAAAGGAAYWYFDRQRNVTLNVINEPMGAGTVVVNPPYDTFPKSDKTRVVLSAQPLWGYTFDHWEIERKLVGVVGNNRLTLTMDDNKTVVAFYKNSSTPGYGEYVMVLDQGWSITDILFDGVGSMDDPSWVMAGWTERGRKRTLRHDETHTFQAITGWNLPFGGWWVSLDGGTAFRVGHVGSEGPSDTIVVTRGETPEWPGTEGYTVIRLYAAAA